MSALDASKMHEYSELLELFIDIKQLESRLLNATDPRRQFNNWRNSLAGQEWKRAQYAKQNGFCPCCGTELNLEDAHIDHVKPTATHPHLALDVSNLRLLRPSCNLRKSSLSRQTHKKMP